MRCKPVVIGIMNMVLASPAMFGQTIHVAFEAGENLVLVERDVEREQDRVTATAHQLVAGPDERDSEFGLTTWIPSGTRVQQIEREAQGLTIELSEEILVGLDEYALDRITRQFWGSLYAYELEAIRLTCGGKPLAAHLKPAAPSERFRNVRPAPLAEPPVAVAPVAEAQGEPVPQAGQALSGRSITIGPSHGRYWAGTFWGWQRSDPCNFGQDVLEDTNSIRLMQFLNQYLEQDGAVVHVPRELDETHCCHPVTGLPWWQMAAYAWVRHVGAPCSVYGSNSGNCGTDQGSNRYADDIRVRPLYADYVGSDIYISHHTNAGGGGTATGTEVFRDSAMEHPEHEADSYDLALLTKAKIETAIQDMYDPTWPVRNNGFPRDSAGGFGEIRIPDMPACLVELAFHDNCSKDAQYLTDPFFRSVSMWGLYDGVCQYFGVTPTYDKYSCEVVSHTLPTMMESGTSVPVTITLRNRGVLWRVSNGFRLGAVGDSDPFTAFNRVDVSGEIRPGEEHTFAFTLTAPFGAGTYTTDWRMVRDGYSWFGPTVSQEVIVEPGTPPADFDDDGDVDLDDYAHLQECFSGSANPQPDPDCTDAKFDADNDVDDVELAAFLDCMSGAGVPYDPDCFP